MLDLRRFFVYNNTIISFVLGEKLNFIMVDGEYTFSKLLRELRAEKKISQTVLARQLSVSQDTISLWETGKSLPDFNSIKLLSIYFEISADYLLGIKNC